ncbi:hypothetical protein B0T19DRAFT_432835 [Cercophora scortea]|uniref:Uncharacterized protein n=1 Tax=Cercophora scortea TaxID=314031 RepID=A0AAE0I703_9PEZI|nr:hypothetical protein B0T19DRAFT_432835 [Cercophora scortea]
METESQKWFEVGSRVGKSPEVLKREHESFKKAVAPVISKSENLASTKEELEGQISKIKGDHDGPSRSSTSAAVDAAQDLNAATKARDAYTQERAKGARKAASAVQHGLDAMAKFISAYSSLLETVMSAGGPYGEVGYQTLSILLIVVVNKSKNDERIVDHLTQIQKSIPRLAVWKAIYPNDTMRELVANAYLQVIEFSRAAAKYFTRFWHRVYLAVAPKATIKFDEAATDLYKTLAEINAEAMLGLHDNTSTIKQRVILLQDDAKRGELDRKQLLDQNQKLIAQNEELQQKIDEQIQEANRRDIEEDMKSLTAFQRLLNVDPNTPSTNLTAVKQVLMQVFPNDLHFSSNVPYTGHLQLNRASLEENPSYQQWLKQTKSTLLFLSGYTAYAGRKLKGTHSWLSPAAIYIAEDLTHQGANVAFFSCHPDFDNPRVPGETMLSSLIFQVLQWRPAVLRNKDAEFRHILSTTPQDKRECGLVTLLAALLGEMQDLKTVYLVIDRLDWCRAPDEYDCDRPIDTITNELARLVTEMGSSEMCVKVAIVAETSGGEGNWHSSFLPEREFAKERLFVVREWNQRSLSPRETSVARRPSIWSEGSGAMGVAC